MHIIDTKEQSGFLQFSFLEQVDQSQLPKSAPKSTSSAASICYHQTKQGKDEDSLISTNSGVKFYAGFGLHLSLLLVWTWPFSFFTSRCENVSSFLVVYQFLHSPSPISSLPLLFSPFTSSVACCWWKARQTETIHLKGSLNIHKVEWSTLGKETLHVMQK